MSLNVFIMLYCELSLATQINTNYFSIASFLKFILYVDK
jgi:hypothetical protein